MPLVARFVRDLAEYEKLAHLAVGTDDQFRALLFGSPPRAHALIADWDGSAVGFALWYFGVSTFKASTKLYLEDVFVAPEARGQGIGRAIFADLARRSIGATPHEGWTTQRLTGDALQALAQ